MMAPGQDPDKMANSILNFIRFQASVMRETPQYKSWMCLLCGFIYEEEKGLPAEGIAPGTRWEDVPINWTCPDCGARKDDFEMIEI